MTSSPTLGPADTIVAITTPPGTGAIGMIRISGPRAVVLASEVVRLVGPASLDTTGSHLVHRAVIVDPRDEAELDTALVTKMTAPRSYTGEDVVELSCHGNPVLLGEIVRLLVAGGARLAEPGEFTRRAYLNGRLDLVQVEAVAELIRARTGRAVRLAARQLRGAASARLTMLLERLVDLIAGLEVVLDFPDDAFGVTQPNPRKATRELLSSIERLMTNWRHGRVVQDGLAVMLAGGPNVGKSSLLNRLLGTDRAIVSATPGTTRDLVDGTRVIRGVPIRLVDGAGLGAPRDPIDDEGMRRARQALAESDLILVVLDTSRPISSEDKEVLALTQERERFVVANKSDLPSAWGDELAVDCMCSALTGAGLSEVVERLERWVEARTNDDAEEGGITASLRVLDGLAAVRTALGRAADGLEEVPIEAVLVDLRDALGELQRVLGLEADEAVLDRIFASFCVGK